MFALSYEIWVLPSPPSPGLLSQPASPSFEEVDRDQDISCRQLAWYPNIRKLIKTLYQERHNHIFLFVFTIKTFMILKILIAFLFLREFSYWTQDNIALNMPLVPLLHLFWRPLCIKILFMMSAVAKHDIAVSPCHKIHICLSPDYGYYRT